MNAPVTEHTSILQNSGVRALAWLDDLVLNSAWAEDSARSPNEEKPNHNNSRGRQIPVGESSQDVQALVNRVDSLVNEMTGLTNNLKQALNPDELRSTMKQLNKTLENASATLSPQSGLNQTAQRTLAKLEDAIEQLRDQMTRVNQGKGSVGMLLNDPSYATELREAIRNVNKLLSKVGGVRFFVDIGGEEVRGYDGGRGWFRLQIFPKPDRYYLLGISLDPRGRRTQLSTDTTTNGVPTVHTSTVQVEQTGILLTGMLGKIFFDNRLDLAIGALNGDGAVSVTGNLGPLGREEILKLETDFYTRGSGTGADARINLIARVFQGVYIKGGIESFKLVNDKIPWSYGAGITFEDEDIKLLFALR
jgi:phospholipid/cholesterol/gamma-HCH transport system substrate-binding protein